MRNLASAAALLLVMSACLPAGDRPQEGLVPGANQSASEKRAVTTAAPAPIVVDSPTSNEELTSPAVLSGSADVFEATVSYRIVSDAGDVVARGFTTATCGSGCRGTFSVTVPYEVDVETSATVELFEESAEDGSPLHKVKVPVTLLPS